MGGIPWPSPPCLLGKTNDLRNLGTVLFWTCSQTLNGQDPVVTSFEPLVQVISQRAPFVSSKFDDEG